LSETISASTLLEDPNYNNVDWDANEKKVQKKRIEEELVKQENEIDKDIAQQVKDYLIIKQRRLATETVAYAFLASYKVYTIRSDLKDELWVYNGKIYVPEAKTYICEYCRKILKSAYTTNFSNEVIEKIITDTYVDEEDFFNNINKEEICVKNGILNLKTRKLHPFTSDKLFLNLIPIYYDETKDCQQIRSFLFDVLESSEDVKLIQEMIGYCLYKDYRIEQSFLFDGKGRNGKGVLIDLVTNFLGIKNVSNISLHRLTDENSFDLSELFGKLANLGGDINSAAIDDTGIYKSLTGNDSISAKRKFMTNINFKNYAKMIYACNKPPHVKDTSDGFWDRWNLIIFPYKFVHQEIYDSAKDEDKPYLKIRDNNLKDKLFTPENFSGLLNWALDGLDRLLAQGHYTFTESNKNVREKWQRGSNSFIAFCNDCIEEDYDGKIIKSDLRIIYNKYCKKNRIEPVSNSEMSKYLTKNLSASSERENDGTRKRYWGGIKIK